MAEYYLISQLPSLDGTNENTPLPITEERFTELCNRFLGKKAKETLKKLALSPSRSSEASGSILIDAWNECERNLRFALGKARADKMKKSFDTENRILPTEYIKAASIATETENPLKAEKYLNNYRLEILEGLCPLDNFSEDYIFYYAIKLKLLLRIRQFNKAYGAKEYKNIYNSILNKKKSEAI